MSMKNMALTFGAMAFMRRLDQEEPRVLQYARLAYLAYVVVSATVYLLLHLRIVARRDATAVTVPVAPKAPSLGEAMAAARAQAEARLEEDGGARPAPGDARRKAGPADAAAPRGAAQPAAERAAGETAGGKDGDGEGDGAPKEEVITVMEYDLRQLANARRTWLRSVGILAAIHYKMESVSPLIMSALMGLTRLLGDDPLVQIHLRGAPAVGPLARPFAPPKNPLAAMLKEMGPGEDAAEGKDPAAAGAAAGAPARAVPDYQEEDGSEEEGAPPPAIADLTDDHIKGDFDEEEEEEVQHESKKTK